MKAKLLRGADYRPGTRVAFERDGRVYVVQADGSVRRALPKPRGKAERRAAKRYRQLARAWVTRQATRHDQAERA